MKSVTLPAYAKVNLYLDVAGTRPDGYHELVTLFERIDLADTLTLERTSGTSIQMSCDDPHLPVGEENLCLRAARLFFETLGSPFGVRMFLKKKIPVAGGLGGGSSDAASTLLALQRLAGEPLAPEVLRGLAQRLGADVAFFLAQTPWALGRGRGDEIEPQPFSARMWHLLVAPGFAIPTKEVYRAFVLTPHRADVTLLLRALKDNEVLTARDFLFNALEPTVEALYPMIRRVKEILQECGAANPLVSGSGSTVMAVCASDQEGKRVLEALKGRANLGWRTFLVATKF